jgi:very-short-patch-repair endonuclease
MPYIPLPYIGWPEYWFDNGEHKVNELIAKYYVNRFFASPEDGNVENLDDMPIMIWVRCITCGYVGEHFMAETVKDWEYILSNRDNTYTLLSDPECEQCKSSHTNPIIREERSNMVEEEYRSMFPEDRNLHFGSAIEEYFWKVWRITFTDYPLLPQFQIGNYYVDFAHLPTKTIVELDGKPYHTSPYQVANDKVRQKNIERHGWRFLRFEGNEIFYHVDRCVIKTLYFLLQIRKELVFEAQYQWRSSPSARLLTRLKERNDKRYDYLTAYPP